MLLLSWLHLKINLVVNNVILGCCLKIHAYCSGLGCSWQQKRRAAALPPTGVRMRMETNRQKLVGGDKGSLTEEQTKGTGTTTIQIKRKHDTNRTTHRGVLPDRTSACAPEPRVSCCRATPTHRNPA